MKRGDPYTDVPVLRVVLLAVTVLVLHVFLLSRFSLFAVRPEPFLLVTVLGSLQLGPRGGAFLGGLAGLGADLLSATPLGVWLLICGVIGLALGAMRDQLAPQRQRAVTIVAVASGTLIGLIVYPAFAFAITEQRYPPLLHYALILVIGCLWNVVLTPAFSLVTRVLFAPPKLAR